MWSEIIDSMSENMYQFNSSGPVYYAYKMFKISIQDNFCLCDC